MATDPVVQRRAQQHRDRRGDRQPGVRGPDPQPICDQLIELALARGAPDNVTALLARVFVRDSCRYFTAMVWRRFVVFPQQIFAEIPVELSPHSMDVIGVVLSIVVLEQKRGRLNPVVVALARLPSAGPSKVHALALEVRRTLFDLFDNLGGTSRQIVRRVSRAMPAGLG